MLSRLLQEKVAQIVARPQLMTVAGQSANVHIGDEVEVAVAGQPDKTSMAFVGTEFSVLPTVDSQGRITLDYICLSSDLNRAKSIAVRDKLYHTVTRCEAASAVMLNDGQRAIVGESAQRVAIDAHDGAKVNSESGKPPSRPRVVNEIRRLIVLTAHVVRPAAPTEKATSTTENVVHPTAAAPQGASGYASPTEALQR